jgi:hypothetical protein
MIFLSPYVTKKTPENLLNNNGWGVMDVIA